MSWLHDLIYSERTVQAILVCILVPANLYPIFYAFRPWRSTPAGRALMTKGVGNMILLDVVGAFILFGDYPGREVVRLIGFTVFAVGIWYLFIAMLRAPGWENYPPGNLWCWVRARFRPTRTRP